MSIRLVLQEQIERNERSIKLYQNKIQSLPKGSLHEKKRGSKVYYYLKYRDENGKRIDKYIQAEEVPAMRKKLKKRKDFEKVVVDLKEDNRIAQKALR